MARRLVSTAPRIAAAIILVVVLIGIGFGFGRRSALPSQEFAAVAEAHEELRAALRTQTDAKLAREAIQAMIRALDDPFAEYLPQRKGQSAADVARRALGVDASSRSSAAGLSARMLSDGIGIVSLKLFAPDSGSLVASEIKRLRRIGMAGLVLDLRSNSGGLVDEAVEVAGQLVGERVIFQYRTASGGQGERIGRGDGSRGLGLVVLVNSRTASSAELVAAAVQDHGRGIIVGERTKGKASVQRVVELSDGSALKFTTATYRTPDGRDLEGVGVAPDVEVAAEQGDPQLQRAVAILKGS